MITIGHEYELDVVKTVDFGFYLDAENLGEVLLPNKFAPPGLAVGDYLVVFLYRDSEDRLVATTQEPKACVGEFAYLKAVANTDFGTFLDWGLDKDVLVPFYEQHRSMEVGHSYLVYLYLDKNDGRIVASSKIDKFLDDEKPHDFEPRQAVKLIIANSTELGYKAIINHSHWGVLYKDEVFQRLSFGQTIDGFIKRVRPDGKIDLSLQGGKQTRDKYADVILKHLKKHDGFAPVHDKSDPQLIAKLFGMSKGAFKKTIGGLYKQQIIRIEKEGIRLTGNSDPQTTQENKTNNNIWNKRK
ncbi:MAG: GntR family transcriptional regulator [Gammaproteobacteria bacterium]|nr:GntR family transcriptional regulator [Gammaproteobacteria bacterium]